MSVQVTELLSDVSVRIFRNKNVKFYLRLSVQFLTSSFICTGSEIDW